MSNDSNQFDENRTAKQNQDFEMFCEGFSLEERAALEQMYIDGIAARKARVEEQKRAAKTESEDRVIREMLLRLAAGQRPNESNTHPPNEATDAILLVAEAAQPQDNVLPTADGPCQPYTWRNNGKLIEGKLQTAAWNLVNHLWKQSSHCACFDDLKVPVYSDSERDADEVAFGSLRRAANKFFGKNKIPWRVGIKKTVVSLTATE